MRFCLDISSIPYGTGVSLYTANLARALTLKVKSPDSLVFFGSSLRQRSTLSAFSPSKIFPLPPKLTSLMFNQLNFSPSHLIGKIDVFHTWDWYAPKPHHFTLVSTVHDLALFKYPGTAHPEIVAHHRVTLTRLKQFNARVIAVSQATKNDLIDLFDFDPNQIKVIYEALPQENRLPAKTKPVKKPYFLLVGTHEPRKNIGKQIQAWRNYKGDYDLVLAGKSGWENIKAEPGIKLLGQVDTHKLAALYQGASVLLYASLYEGFGLPLLEAFYHQVPVVTSNLSSMPEVAGDAAVLVDPNDVESISVGIKKALDQHKILVTRGLKRLKQYSWEQAARQTLEFYSFEI